MSSAAASAKTTATSADASMTFVAMPAIPVRPDYRRRFVATRQSKGANLGQNLVDRAAVLRLHRRLDDRHQFALQRAMVPRRPLAQALHDIIGRILDR